VVTIHGIKACDTMKKAQVWLDGHGVAYGFHDYKTKGIDAATLRGWAAKVGWEILLNRNGTTFRGLPDAAKADLDEAKATEAHKRAQEALQNRSAKMEYAKAAAELAEAAAQLAAIRKPLTMKNPSTASVAKVIVPVA
jgi:arsenate reductase-like glutaredoxin family protein